MHSYKSPMLTPSPLRRKAFTFADSDTSHEGELGLETPVDPDDFFSQSPYHPAAPLKSFDAHLRSVAGPSGLGKNSMPYDNDDDLDDAHIFLSTPAATSTPAPKAAQRARRSERQAIPTSIATPAPASRRRTPAKHTQTRPRSTIETSTRHRSPPPPLPRPFSIAQPRLVAHTPPTSTHPLPLRPQRTPVLPAQDPRLTTTGVKRKSTELPVTSPYPKGMLTPLAVTKTSGTGSFDRLAPLPAPKFRESPRQEGDAEGFLRESGTMERLSIGEKRQDLKEEMSAEEAVDVSPGGHIVKRRAKSRPVSWDLKVRTSNALPGPPVRGHKASASSSVAFPATAPMPPARTSTVNDTLPASPKRRQRLSHNSNVSTRSRVQSGAQSAGLRPPVQRAESSGSATLFFGPVITRTSTPAKGAPRLSQVIDSPPSSLPRQPLFSRTQTAQRHSYAGPAFSPILSSPSGDTSPVMAPLATDDDRMGEITDEDEDQMPDMAMIADMDEETMGMDEEDIFFQSSGFNTSLRSDEGVGTDEDSFSWGSAPAHTPFFSVNVTGSTPSPRGKKASGPMLEKKFKPRDSGISLSDEEEPSRLALPRPSGRGFGRSGSVSMMPPPALTMSTSSNTVASSEDMELETPGFGPSSSSGWPAFLSSSGSEVDGPASLLAATQSEEDAFILRTLLQAQSADTTTSAAASKRPPDTPQKRARVAVGPRPWQSAIASKVGFDFGTEDSDGGAGAGDKKAKKKPRKSLPAAFPSLGQGRRKNNASATAVVAACEDTEDEGSDQSPSGRAVKERYEGLGLGRPSAGRLGRASWLLRRSSSGAISTMSGGGSQSGDGSWPATPTGGKTGGGWQLPPPRIPSHISPVKARLPSHLSPARTASGSSTSTAATASPTGSRLFQLSSAKARAGDAGPERSAPSVTRDSIRLSRGRVSMPFLPAAAAASSEEANGKFEREFVEVGEVGSGEFGKVMKVRRKAAASSASKDGAAEGEAWAVKKSKRFEGARHRLRLHEEVDILRLLSESYARVAAQPGARHPNVLAYVDAWEQDDALYIQTELCELGNFAHFLWEYGRAFPQLDEARVWKILADLSNGLRFIHSAGVLHLDLKPANVFVTGAGRFKIGDFGMASVWPRAGPSPAAVAATEERPPGFEREGDKCYLAPEVLQGRYGTAADMFSLGITMLETAANIVVPDQGEPWHRLRMDDFTQVDFGAASGALIGLIRGMMCSEPARRVDAESLWAHPIVARTRAAMDRARDAAGAGGGGSAFVASPLAPVPSGFLEEILGGYGSGGVGTGINEPNAMDVCA